jgi:hypothetical protein
LPGTTKAVTSRTPKAGCVFWLDIYKPAACGQNGVDISPVIENELSLLVQRVLMTRKNFFLLAFWHYLPTKTSGSSAALVV